MSSLRQRWGRGPGVGGGQLSHALNKKLARMSVPNPQSSRELSDFASSGAVIHLPRSFNTLT